MPTNKTSKDVEVTANMTMAQVKAAEDVKLRLSETNKLKLAELYRNQEKVNISIPPFYAPYLGRVSTMILNGISVCIPCDGKIYSVPKSFADEFMHRIHNIDAIVAKGKKLGNVSNNSESFAGELRF